MIHNGNTTRYVVLRLTTLDMLFANQKFLFKSFWPIDRQRWLAFWKSLESCKQWAIESSPLSSLLTLMITVIVSMLFKIHKQVEEHLLVNLLVNNFKEVALFLAAEWIRKKYQIFDWIQAFVRQAVS